MQGSHRCGKITVDKYFNVCHENAITDRLTTDCWCHNFTRHNCTKMPSHDWQLNCQSRL